MCNKHMQKKPTKFDSLHSVNYCACVHRCQYNIFFLHNMHVRCENHTAHKVQSANGTAGNTNGLQTSGNIRMQASAPAVYKRHNVEAAVVV